MQDSKAVWAYSNPQDANTEDDYDMKPLQYPFQELGPIKMHIPYHFVIVNSGEKLEQLFPDPLMIDFEAFFPWADIALRSRMVMVHRLYRIWMRCQPDFTPRSKPSDQGSVLESGLRRSAHHASRGGQSDEIGRAHV